jgi:predicted acetylornithine/succinylornithine family transaminase
MSAGGGTATGTPLEGALIGVYGERDLTLVRGEGCRVEDDQGRRYLDFCAGIAVSALGHASRVVEDAVREALDRGLVHTSNLYRTRPAQELAGLLVDHAFPGGVFFCNSGAEANEAALKFARRWARDTHGAHRTGFVAFRGAFHGRLFGTLATTDRPRYQEPFRPLMPGVRFAELGDLDGVARLLEDHPTAAVLVEPVQGEGGIVPVEDEFLRGLRELCDRTGTLLVFDEVQCGLGRTGRLFAWEHAGVTPDVLTLAKPLAGGFPMGAVVASTEVATSLHPGDHATTFGGGPLIATVAAAVVRTVAEPDFLEAVRAKGRRLAEGLRGLGHEAVEEVRGRGLMQGLVLREEADPVGPVVARARDLGLLLVGAGPRVVRFVPPLTVDEGEIDEAVSIVGEALA